MTLTMKTFSNFYMHFKSLADAGQRVCAALAFVLCSSIAFSQPVATSKVVAKGNVSIPEREAVLSVNDLGAGIVVGRHTHPGDEIGYVVEGEIQLLVDGQAPRNIKAGEGYIVQSGVVHSAVVVGTTPAKLIATHVVVKGQPLRRAEP